MKGAGDPEAVCGPSAPSRAPSLYLSKVDLLSKPLCFHDVSARLEEVPCHLKE